MFELSACTGKNGKPIKNILKTYSRKIQFFERIIGIFLLTIYYTDVESERIFGTRFGGSNNYYEREEIPQDKAAVALG